MTRTPSANLSYGSRSRGKGHYTTTATIKYSTLLECGWIRPAIPHRKQRIRLIVSRRVRAEWERA